MRHKNHSKKRGGSGGSLREREAAGAGAALAILCCLLLSFTAFDCEKYSDNAVPAAITFTAPEKQEEEGFWDIFTEAVVHLFVLEG